MIVLLLFIVFLFLLRIGNVSVQNIEKKCSQ